MPAFGFRGLRSNLRREASAALADPNAPFCLEPSPRDGRATFPAMPPEVLQRLAWNGIPVDMGNLFTVHKGKRGARATLFSHPFGWELRLLLGARAEVVQTHVCRSQDEVLSTADGWKERLLQEGWSA